MIWLEVFSQIRLADWGGWMDLTISELKVSPPAWVTWVVTLVDLSSVKIGRIEFELLALFGGIVDCARRGKMNSTVSPCRTEGLLTGRRQEKELKLTVVRRDAFPARISHGVNSSLHQRQRLPRSSRLSRFPPKSKPCHAPCRPQIQRIQEQRRLVGGRRR